MKIKEIPVKEVIVELNREYELRKVVYPNRIKDGKISTDTAQRQLNRLMGVILHLQGEKTKVPLESMITELNRELQLREKLYPKWISNGTLHRDRARTQWARIKRAVNLIEGEKEEIESKQTELF